MKRRFRNIIRDGIIGLNPFYGRAQSGKRIVAFHDIYSSEMFVKKMQLLRNHYNIVSVSDILSDDHEQTIAITFDDGYDSWIEYVYPYFNKYNIPCTFFINSGFVLSLDMNSANYVKKNLRRDEENLRPLSVQAIKKLASSHLFDFGGHSTDHIDFSCLSDVSNELIVQQIRDDKKMIEQWTGRKVNFFAYPFGQSRHAPNRVVEFLKQSGYQAAFTAVPNFVGAADIYRIGRDALEFWQSDEVWLKWLNGAYDTMYSVKEKLYSGKIQ